MRCVQQSAPSFQESKMKMKTDDYEDRMTLYDFYNDDYAASGMEGAISSFGVCDVPKPQTLSYLIHFSFEVSVCLFMKWMKLVFLLLFFSSKLALME